MKAFQIVTIEREYASGGTQVGRLLGKALGVPVYGREILEIAAQESGTTPEYIEQLEETDTNSLLYSLVAMGKTSLGQLPEISRTDQLNVLEGEIIQRLAQQGPCVLVGRCAGWVLRERDGYHLVLDSGLLGAEFCAKILEDVVLRSRG